MSPAVAYRQDGLDIEVRRGVTSKALETHHQRISGWDTSVPFLLAMPPSLLLLLLLSTPLPP